MINKKTTIKELALIVASKLKESNIDTVLVGGAVVSIYTNNEYESGDLDFISHGPEREIIKAMSSINFKKEGKSFVSDQTDLYVEFPSGPVSIGDELVDNFKEITDNKGLVLKLLTPTQSIMDRLASFCFWNDSQSLDQAVLISKSQPFSISKVEKWSKKERELEKFKIFKARASSEIKK